MKTLNENYKKNIEVLKENLKRGLSQDQAVSIIDNMEKQFKKAGLYNKEEVAFIEEMKSVAGIKTIKAKDLMGSLGIEVREL